MSEEDEYIKQLEIQRRNFELQFGSLESMGYQDKSRTKSGSHEMSDSSGSESQDGGNEEDDSDSEDKFQGFSSDDEGSSETSDSDTPRSTQSQTETPKVVKLVDEFSGNKTVISKADKKLLRSGRVPTLAEMEEKEKLRSKMTAKQRRQAEKEDEDNVENDIKLQRLLKESHILANQLEYSGASVSMETLDFEAPTGKARKRTLESRIRSLASTNSSSSGRPKKLESMPMSMRKGMIKSREKKISKYEEDAKNAGIVLSKIKKGDLRDLDSGKGSTFSSDRLGTGKKNKDRIRDRGLKINSIGRSTRNGLIIPQKDIDRINKPSGSKSKSKGGRR